MMKYKSMRDEARSKPEQEYLTINVASLYQFICNYLFDSWVLPVWLCLKHAIFATNYFRCRYILILADFTPLSSHIPLFPSAFLHSNPSQVSHNFYLFDALFPTTARSTSDTLFLAIVYTILTGVGLLTHDCYMAHCLYFLNDTMTMKKWLEYDVNDGGRAMSKGCHMTLLPPPITPRAWMVMVQMGRCQCICSMGCLSCCLCRVFRCNPWATTTVKQQLLLPTMDSYRIHLDLWCPILVFACREN